MFLLPDFVTVTPQNCLCLVLVCFKLPSLQALNLISFCPQTGGLTP